MKPRNLIPFLLCALLLLFLSLAHSGEPLTINFGEARNHIGERAVVKGMLAQISLRGNTVFLDFGSANPNEVFTAVSHDLPFSALSAFEGKPVFVWGTIVDYKGKPSIIISNLAQITVSAQRNPDRDTGATWRTYPPGQAPPGRTMSMDEVGALANRGEVNGRIYLRGEFRVTASGTSRAVLRDANLRDEQSPCVVVQYPPGHAAPREGEHLIRDATRPYQINVARRVGYGVITIYVREIINE